MRRPGTTTAAVFVAGVLLLAAACGDDSDSAVSTTTTAQATTTSSAGASTTAAPVATSSTVADSSGDKLPEGTSFGYITTLVSSHGEISGEFDLAQLLTGAEAQKAAAEDGAEAFDYYVRNVNPKLRPIVVDPDAEVLDVDYDNCCQAQLTTVAKFIEDRDAKQEQRTAVYLTVTKGVVTRIDEQYFP